MSPVALLASSRPWGGVRRSLTGSRSWLLSTTCLLPLAAVCTGFGWLPLPSLIRSGVAMLVPGGSEVRREHAPAPALDLPTRVAGVRVSTAPAAPSRAVRHAHVRQTPLRSSSVRTKGSAAAPERVQAPTAAARVVPSPRISPVTVKRSTGGTNPADGQTTAPTATPGGVGAAPAPDAGPSGTFEYPSRGAVASSGGTSGGSGSGGASNGSGSDGGTVSAGAAAPGVGSTTVNASVGTSGVTAGGAANVGPATASVDAGASATGSVGVGASVDGTPAGPADVSAGTNGGTATAGAAAGGTA